MGMTQQEAHVFVDSECSCQWKGEVKVLTLCQTLCVDHVKTQLSLGRTVKDVLGVCPPPAGTTSSPVS